jgi:type IV pilus assembly protein PilQ
VRIEAKVEPSEVRIEAKATAPFDFTTYRPSDRLFVMDLAGVTPATAAGSRVLKSDVVSSYRVLPYRGGDRSIVRVEVLLRAPVEPRVDRLGPDGVALVFAAKPSEGAAAATATTREAVKRSSDDLATAIESVSVTGEPNAARVLIQGNGRLTCEVARLTNPNRVVVDFSGVKARVPQKQITSAIAPVKGVRISQFKPNVARVVIDLEENQPHNLRANGNTIMIDIAPKQAAAGTKPAGAVAPPTVTAAKDTAPVPAETKAEAAEPAIPLPQSLTQPAAAHAAPAAKLEVQAPAQATPQTETPAAAPSASPGAEPVAPVPQAAAQGEPISVNLKDVDLKDFFRLIHEISGLNVVVDPNVRGTVTLVLDDVPWNQALDIVLRNNGLDKQLEGNVLRIATRETLRKEAEARRDLAKAQAEAVDQITTTRTLSYAKATAVRDTLKRFLSSRGEILADERSNTLIIRDIPAVLPDMDNLIKQLDRRTQQVEIEARVVAATRAFAREIGTQFGFATTSTGGRTVWGGLVGNSDFVSPVTRGSGLPTPPLVASGTNSIPLNTNLGAVAPTSGLTFAHSSPNFALDFIISAAESRGVGKLLSKPKVITQNNQKATVKQGTKIPVQTVINNTISVQFVDAVLKLEVTPQIAADGTVFLELVVENTAIESGIPRVNGIPALTTQSTETSVLINDGGTVVVGGVIISRQTTDIAQVPLFGSIPLIGHLFKRTKVETSSQELYFFITPRIIPN